MWHQIHTKLKCFSHLDRYDTYVKHLISTCLCVVVQAAMPDSLSASSVEQRLLELNRQSAAARSRLLELIEQQRQSTSARVSPSISPIPPSAFSPHTAGMADE